MKSLIKNLNKNNKRLNDNEKSLLHLSNKVKKMKVLEAHKQE